MHRLSFSYVTDPFCCGLLSVGNLHLKTTTEQDDPSKIFIEDLRSALIATGTTRAFVVVHPSSQSVPLSVVRKAFGKGATEVEWTSRTTDNELLFIFSPEMW